MNTYVILRRDGWRTADDLQLADTVYVRPDPEPIAT